VSARTSFSAIASLVALVCWSQSATANDVSGGTVSADCKGYAVTVGAVNLTPNTTYTSSYSVALSCTGAPTSLSVPGTLPITNNNDGTGSGNAGGSWSTQPNGTCSVTATATITQNTGETPVSLTPQGTTSSFTCTPPPQCTGSIGNFVWYDANGNGLQDSGEQGINGVTLHLKNSSGSEIATTTTPTGGGSPGYYQFTGLCKGTYTVVVDQTTLPNGYTPTIGCAGDVAKDSNYSAVNSSCNGTVTLPDDNSSNQDTDFGYVLPQPGKNFSIGPSSMEGHLTILAGDWISGGYSFTFKNGSHAATNMTVSATATLDVTCPKGGGSGGTITVPLGAKTYSVPAGNTNWLPTGDANSVLSWMGSAMAPNLCGGNPMDNAKGAVFHATVTQNPPTGSLVNYRFKYRDPNAKGKGNVNCLDTSDPRRAKADVCGASWSGTVTDP
jgi:hypothetical protein